MRRVHEMKSALPKSRTDYLPILTPTHFFQYETHPLWIWYDLFGDQSQKEEMSEFALKLMRVSFMRRPISTGWITLKSRQKKSKKLAVRRSI